VPLLVNETTLLPLLMPLAPGSTLLARTPAAVADLLVAHRLPAPFIEAEWGRDHRGPAGADGEPQRRRRAQRIHVPG
jgi:hypothetical protein